MRKIDVPLAFAASATALVVAAIFITSAGNQGPSSAANQKSDYWEWISSAAFWTALFTGVLTWSTVKLWRETKRLAEGAEAQREDMKDSIAVALMAANATRKAADAAMGVEIPRPILTKIQSDKPGANLKEWLHDCRLGAQFENHGRTSATVIENSLIWRICESLAPVPNYPLESVQQVTTTMIVEPTAPFMFSRPFALSEDEIARILSGDGRLWVYGYVTVRDFLNIDHRTGFCRVLELVPNKRYPAMEPSNSRFSYGGPNAYTYTRIAPDKD